jgi:hypothetical protein
MRSGGYLTAKMVASHAVLSCLFIILAERIPRHTLLQIDYLNMSSCSIHACPFIRVGTCRAFAKNAFIPKKKKYSKTGRM